MALKSILESETLTMHSVVQINHVLIVTKLLTYVEVCKPETSQQI